MSLAPSPPRGATSARPISIPLTKDARAARTDGTASAAPAALASLWEIASGYLQAGLCVLPIRRDGTKAPALDKWKWLERELPSADQLTQWWGGRHPPGIAIICGAVSGNLELIDFDREAESIYPQWCQLVEEERPGLVARLCLVRSPRPGWHVRYRVVGPPVPGNTKLAIDPEAPRNDRVLIETRGEGGYALAPGCPPGCHETGGPTTTSVVPR
jgi:putative DNA primase/helicase